MVKYMMKEFIPAETLKRFQKNREKSLLMWSNELKGDKKCIDPYPGFACGNIYAFGSWDAKPFSEFLNLFAATAGKFSQGIFQVNFIPTDWFLPTA